MEIESHTHLELTLSSKFSWKNHILNMYANVSKALNVLEILKYKLNIATFNSLYKSNIRPLMEYSDVIWYGMDVVKVKLIFWKLFNMKQLV